MEVLDLSLREDKILASVILYLLCEELMEAEWTGKLLREDLKTRYLIHHSL
jgi:hypothetical protein